MSYELKWKQHNSASALLNSISNELKEALPTISEREISSRIKDIRYNPDSGKYESFYEGEGE